MDATAFCSNHVWKRWFWPQKLSINAPSVSISFVPLSCFLCLDSLFWHGIASLNLVISTQHHYSAQIDFDMHEPKLFLFSYALRYHHNVWYQNNERRENALDNEAYGLIQTWVAMKIFHWKNGFPFYWDTLYNSTQLDINFLTHLKYITGKFTLIILRKWAFKLRIYSGASIQHSFCCVVSRDKTVYKTQKKP